ncbi:MAG: VCBS repeat-containing protein [Spirosomaceae bacterium]|jgi:hypothetical protein|nr:VCBS repeat-containing protein [Spirosomataceae bacterium]
MNSSLRRFGPFGVAALLISCINACEVSNEQMTAKTYCSSCHAFPEPNLLDKKTWKEHTLPKMAVWLGLTPVDTLLKGQPFEDIEAIKKSGAIAQTPMMSQETWQKIVDYYVKNAPEKLPALPPQNYKNLEEGFGIEPAPFQPAASVTMLSYQPTLKKLLVGNREGKMYVLDRWQKQYEHQFESAPSMASVNKNGTINVTVMGFMEPNNGYEGKLYQMSPKAGWLTMPVLSGLQRPVGFVQADLNRDQRDDFVVSNFGYLMGKLSLYEQLPDNSYQERLIYNVPGALQTTVGDFDGNGRTDLMVLMAQGNEGVFVFYNKPNGRWDMEQVLRFPPAFGSSYMEATDFDKDGDKDLLIANGDNGDYSIVLKPYHGIRVYLNDGTNHFKESFFFPMYGATKALARDFDRDGDMDIAAIAYFAHYTQPNYHNFVWLRNDGPKGFVPFGSTKTNAGRWLVMEAFDGDNDGDDDLVLGSCINTPLEVPAKVRQQWENKGTAVMWIENHLKR